MVKWVREKCKGDSKKGSEVAVLTSCLVHVDESATIERFGTARIVSHRIRMNEFPKKQLVSDEKGPACGELHGIGDELATRKQNTENKKTKNKSVRERRPSIGRIIQTCTRNRFELTLICKKVRSRRDHSEKHIASAS